MNNIPNFINQILDNETINILSLSTKKGFRFLEYLFYRCL